MADIVTKSPPPQATGEGSGSALGNMTLADIQGVASSALDPMRGRFVSEDDPRAKAILAKQQEQIRNARQGKHSNGRMVVPAGKHKFEPGFRVFHARRKMFGVVAKYSTDGKKIEVIFPKGERALVQIANLEKV